MISGTPRRYLAAAPPERLAALRIITALFAVIYLAARLPHMLDVAQLARSAPQRFQPVGPLVVLGEPLPVAAVGALVVATIVIGVAAVVGWRWRVSGPVFAAGVLATLSYRNSWGQIFHTENLLVVHLCILAISPAADAWSLDHHRSGTPPRPPRPSYGWPTQLMVIAVVVAYVVAGWAKVRASGFSWANGDALANLVAHDALRKELVGDSASPLARHALSASWLFPPMATVSLAVELGAPIALLGGRWRVGWVAAAIVFHLGVVAVMGILFPYQLFAVAFAAFVTIEAIPRRWLHRRSPRAILAT